MWSSHQFLLYSQLPGTPYCPGVCAKSLEMAPIFPLSSPLDPTWKLAGSQKFLKQVLPLHLCVFNVLALVRGLSFALPLGLLKSCLSQSFPDVLLPWSLLSLSLGSGLLYALSNLSAMLEHCHLPCIVIYVEVLSCILKHKPLEGKDCGFHFCRQQESPAEPFYTASSINIC